MEKEKLNQCENRYEVRGDNEKMVIVVKKNSRKF